MSGADPLRREAPDPAWTPAQTGLYWATRVAWDRAHAAVQDDASQESAWVHAHLHREEVDLGNAGFWYRRAGRASSVLRCRV